MGQPKITFGDKMFLYGQYLQNLYEFSEYQYNSVIGYMTVGGYNVTAQPTAVTTASVPGFVVDFSYSGSLAPITPFDQVEMVDVTDKLSFSPPILAGSKVWMPTTPLL